MADENVNNYYDEFIKNYAKDEIEGYTNEQILEALQEFLVKNGYERAHAEAAVLYVTNGECGIDFSDFLDVKPDSKLAAKLASLDAVKVYSNYATISSYATIFKGLYDDLNDIEEYRLPDGRYNYEGEKKLESSLYHFMDLSGNLSNKIPCGKIISIPLEQLKDGIHETIEKGNAWDTKRGIAYFMENHDLIGQEAWDNLLDNYGDFKNYDSSNVELGEDKEPYKYGPSIEQMEAVFQDDVPDYFDEYISWRVKYEFEQKLRENFTYPEFYYEKMEKLKPSILQKIWNATKRDVDSWNNTWQKYGENLYVLDHFRTEKAKKIIGDIFNKVSSKNWIVNPIISGWKGAGSARYVVDPLIFDLDGDGFNITDKSNGAYFDKDNNGYRERIDWTNKDAFLVLDRNKNGKIDNGSELFGDTTYIEGSDEYAENGFAALQQYDENGDGIIDSKDSVYDNLRLWVDANGDGVSEESELSTLADHGITSISAVADEERINTGTSAVIDGTSTFTYEDGTAGRFGALWATANYYDTKGEGIADYEGINTAQMGNMPTLATALANDDGTLQGYIDAFNSASSYSEKMENLDNILFTMSGAQDIAEKSRGSNIDARKLHVIETIMGEKFNGVDGADPNPTAANVLKNMYNSISDLYYTIFNIDAVEPYLDELLVAEYADGSRKYYTDNMCMAILNEMVNNPDTTILTDVCKYLMTFGVDGEVNYDVILALNDFFSYDEASNVAVSKELTAYNIYIGTDSGDTLHGSGNADILFGEKGNDTLCGGDGDDELHGGAENDTLIGNDGDDILDGGAGDDNLYGNFGDDTYVFGKGYGNDVITDYSGSNKIKFVGLKPEDLYVTYPSGIQDAILTIAETGETLTLKEFTYNEINRRQFTLEFDDGTEMALDEAGSPFLNVRGTDNKERLEGFYGNGTLSGLDGNDELIGTNGDDVLDGGAGDDILHGYSGDDTYVFGKGYGNDVIFDGSGTNKIKFVGLKPEDLYVTYQHDTQGAMLTIAETGETLRIDSFRYYTGAYRKFTLEFDDGTEMALDAEESPFLNVKATSNVNKIDGYYNNSIVSGTESNNYIYGSKGDDTIYGEAGNDYLYGDYGDDILDGGEGNDDLAGGYGNDIYIYGKGYGNDVITDGCDNNRIKLIGLKPEDISVTFPSGSNDAVITITETEETLTLIKFNYYNGHYRNFTLEFDNGITGHIDDKAANIILDVIETAEAEITVEQTNAEYLSDLYADDVFSEEFTTDSTVIAEVNDSVHIGNSGYEIADMANIQAMILAENMSAFSNESQISSGINVSDITSDSSALDQLLVNSSIQ